MDKVLLSGFVVLVIGGALALLLDWFSLPLPTDWLNDGDITLRELLRFVADILIYITTFVGAGVMVMSKRFRESLAAKS